MPETPGTSLILRDGTRLERVGDVLLVQPAASSHAQLQMNGANLILTLGGPSSCCDTEARGDPFLLRFESVRGDVVLDGTAYTARAVTAAGYSDAVIDRWPEEAPRSRASR